MQSDNHYADAGAQAENENRAALKIQKIWRGYNTVTKWKKLVTNAQKQSIKHSNKI